MFDEVETDGEFVKVAAHSIIPIWAGAKTDGTIEMFYDDGQKLVKSSFQKDASPCIVQWHPVRRFLAASWSTGLVGVWSEMEELLREAVSHRSSISCMEWSMTGHRLITCDEEGDVIVWKVDMRGKISSICQYRLKGSVNRCIFRKSVAAAKAENRQKEECSSFFLASSSGKIYFADDMGRCSEAGSFSSNVMSMELFEERDIIVIITTDLQLSQYSINADGKLNLENEFKVSTIGLSDTKSLKLSWIEEGVLAMVSGSSNIRLLDIFNEESTLLTSPAASESGSLIIWKNQMNLQDGQSGAKTWQVWTSLPVGPGVESIVWGATGAMLVVKKKNMVKVLTEQKMCAATYKDISALQISSTSLRLQREGAAPLELEIHERIRHIALSLNVIGVCNGSSIQVFEYNDDLSNAKLQSSITSDSCLICLDHQNVIVGYSQRIEIFSLAGTLKNSVNIGSMDGTIRLLSCSSSILAATTSKNTLKIYDISRREPRFVISKSWDEQAAKTIQSLSVNANGTLIAFLGVRDSDGKYYIVRPVSLMWDYFDHRILVCETSNFEIFSFFASSDHGIIYHDRYIKRFDLDTLIGVYMPYHYYVTSGAVTPTVYRRLLLDFVDLEDADNMTTSAMVEFGYQVDIGNLDEAFKALNKINNERVWRNLARICVNKMRIDVATVCLCNIKHAKAVRALRKVEKEATPELKAAILAIFLDMHDEVQQIYQRANRYDLLNQYYQACGSVDLPNSKTTFVKFGRYLLDIGDRTGAVAAFEKANSICNEGPQKLFASESELRRYVLETKDKTVKKWWAQYEETRGGFQEALKFYGDGDDVLSIVRLYCVSGKMAQAIDLANSSGNPAAAYYIARQYEREEKIPEAINFYGQARCFTQAIRLAKDYNLVNQLISFALQVDRDTMLDVARAGHFSKAIELCFQAREFQMLEDLAQSLGPDTEAPLLQKCADFFIDNEQYEKAVHLLATAKKYSEALSLCVSKNIKITEELADNLGGSVEESEINVNQLVDVAEVCLQQRSYHLACKKFSQAGERVKAMKALLKSGDTDRIIFFANVSGPKQKDIYVIAANYLQTLDWRNNPNIMKAIIGFYTKSRSFESLAGFYEACCQVEIDEYQNYDKGLAALRESAKCLSKSKDSKSLERISMLQSRIGLIEMFVAARAAAKTNIPDMFRLCDQLLQEPDVESAVRSGDIFALMIETQYASGNIQKAKEILRVMQTRVSAVNLDYYLDANVLKALKDKPQESSKDDDVEEEIRSDYE
ncbi:hypothetical protein HDU76_003527 [Blyttiomyces sp. JEL0837]|nr:hypothetical protein HDU76_003527 [Blyttiomyces sp. JEL0837]